MELYSRESTAAYAATPTQTLTLYDPMPNQPYTSMHVKYDRVYVFELDPSFGQQATGHRPIVSHGLPRLACSNNYAYSTNELSVCLQSHIITLQTEKSKQRARSHLRSMRSSWRPINRIATVIVPWLHTIHLSVV